MKRNYILLTIVFLLISACGGGGGGSSQPDVVSVPPSPNSPSDSSTPATPSEPVSQPDTPSFSELKAEFESHYEYSRHWGLETINASSAYARGATGNNVLIGITDSGLDDTHAEIVGANLSPNSDLEY